MFFPDIWNRPHRSLQLPAQDSHLLAVWYTNCRSGSLLFSGGLLFGHPLDND